MKKNEIFISTCGKLHGNIEMELSDNVSIEMSSFDCSDMADYNSWFSYFMKNSYKAYCVHSGYTYYNSDFLTKEEVEKELHNRYNYGAYKDGFVSIDDFMKKATFVGQEFARSKPVNNMFNYFSDDEVKKYTLNSVIALYEFVDSNGLKWFLSFDKENSRYEVVTPMYTKDNNYKLFGEKYDEFSNKEEIINDIIKQMNKRNVRTRF